jgi:hypothetical protein
MTRRVGAAAMEADPGVEELLMVPAVALVVAAAVLAVAVVVTAAAEMLTAVAVVIQAVVAESVTEAMARGVELLPVK